MIDSAARSIPVDNDWVSVGVQQLVELQNPDSGWGYHRGGTSAVEPTVLACLALQAHSSDKEVPHNEFAVRGARWLEQIQQPDGALGVTGDLSAPRWPTAYGLLAWTLFPDFRSPARQALNWLLNEKGERGSPNNVVHHDYTLQGWPWRSKTHSWVEPTAVSVLALRRAGYTAHKRTKEGMDLILDRAIVTGGWNYGNKKVFGTELRPQPATTGLALMALAEMDGYHELIDRACSYLVNALQEIRSTMSLCWGLTGLTAWHHRPLESEIWVREAFELLQHRQPSARDLACLLLGSGNKTWEMLAPQRNHRSEVNS